MFEYKIYQFIDLYCVDASEEFSTEIQWDYRSLDFFWKIIAIKLRKKHRTTHKNIHLAADSVDVNKDIGGV